jgi:hypothetical protein
MKIALAIPSIRPDALHELIHSEGYMSGPRYEEVHLFADKEPNWSWAAKMRTWWLASGCDIALTIQDDTMLSPRFWPELRAMLTHLPKRALLGLASVHPMQTEIYRQGLRWYATQCWTVGWGVAWHMSDLAEFDAWCNVNPERVRATSEDSLANQWAIETKRVAWHPVPAICDHRTDLDSTYANDAHVHRRPLVTWRDVDADLTRPEYWLPSGKAPPLLRMPLPKTCWFCRERAPMWHSEQSGCLICGWCVTRMVESRMG